MLRFDGFALDPSNEQLWRGNSKIALKPKAFAVLRYLIEHPGRLITKQELLDSLWRDVHVGDAVLKSQLRDVRTALHDDAKSPRLIETVHRRGYRFVAPLDPSPEALAAPATSSVPRCSAPGPRIQNFVGRQLELDRMNACLERALAGSVQITFLAGDDGAGKTSLAWCFLEQLESRDGLRVARGQCIEQQGTGEAYLALLEALERLFREGGCKRIGERPERLLRELAQTILTVSEHQPLVLLLEDLHWADEATLRLLSYLLRRGDLRRVMIIATYRPRALFQREHGFGQLFRELVISARSEEISLTELDDAALSQYLATRFVTHRFPAEVVRVLSEQTSGNPLLIRLIVDHWVQRECLLVRDERWQLAAPLDQLARTVPDTLSRTFRREIDQLSTFERSVLEAASVIGLEFSMPTLAATLGKDILQIEELCAGWARRGQFLRLSCRRDRARDKAQPCCAFQHGLYRQIAYDGITTARLGQLRRRVALGARLELDAIEEPGNVAIEPCLHFECTQERRLALRYSSRASRASKATLGD